MQRQLILLICRDCWCTVTNGCTSNGVDRQCLSSCWLAAAGLTSACRSTTASHAQHVTEAGMQLMGSVEVGVTKTQKGCFGFGCICDGNTHRVELWFFEALCRPPTMTTVMAACSSNCRQRRLRASDIQCQSRCKLHQPPDLCSDCGASSHQTVQFAQW
jgi:hypothetical protein